MQSDNHILHQRRRAGILLHPTSLPGPLPRGLVCHDAYRFIDFLSHSGITVWQMLPLGPTHSDLSPYQSLSAHACDMSLLSLDWLKDRGLLKSTEAADYSAHRRLLEMAWSNLQRMGTSQLFSEYREFIAEFRYWIDDYGLYMAIREHLDGVPWTQWPAPLRNRDKKTLARISSELAENVGFHCFTQFIFYKQWQGLKAYAKKRGVLLYGDMPIYVSHDSADVWLNQHLFLLDQHGEPEIIAGVPPDYFSAEGQRWGNPQYDWEAMQAEGFRWWRERMQTQFSLFDLLRIDHFRGFQAYWEIAADEETAINGKWVEAPGESLLSSLSDYFHQLPLVAEDLGVITDEVTELREKFALPGMKILQFAFDGDPGNSYLPHNHEFNSTVYTGTHDNDTTVSWYQNLEEEEQSRVCDYLGIARGSTMPWPLIRCALSSTSCLTVLPMQDILELGEGYRMNTPGTTEGNWQWRFDWQQLPDGLPKKLQHFCRLYGR